jgi:hypothetical protein
MNLRLSGTGTNGTPRNQVRGVLRTDGIEKFTSSRKTQLVYIKKQTTSNPKPFVDLEAPVEIGIVDEAFPANSCARFFKVNAHYDV